MADRSVVVRLLANVTDFKASMKAAERSTEDLERDLRSLDGRRITAHVNVDDHGSVGRAAAGVNGLVSAAMAVSPALGAIGTTAVAGIGAIAPLAAAAAGGLGVLALGFSGVGEAVGLLADRQQATGAALDTVNQKLAQVNPATLEFARYIQGDVMPAVQGLQQTAAAGLLPGVQEGIDTLMPNLPRLADFVGGLAESFGDLAAEGARALNGPVWSEFFAMIAANAVPIMDDLFRTLGNVATGFAGVTTAFAPMSRDLSGGILDLSRRFAEWGAQLADSEGFRTFTNYVAEQWPKIQQIVGNLAETIGDLIEAGAPIGSAYLTGFQLLTEVLAGLPVGVVQALLMAFIGYKAITGVADLINGVTTAVRSVGTAFQHPGLANFAIVKGGIDEVGTAAGNATGKVDGAAGAFGRFASVAGGAAAVAGGMMILGTAVAELDRAMAPAPPTMEAYTAALLGIEGGIGRLDVMAQQLGANTTTEITGFGDALTRVTDPSAMDRLNDFGGALFNVVTLGSSDTGEGAASRRRTLDFLGGLDASLAQMVSSGNADVAAEKYRILEAEAAKHGVTTEQLIALFPQYQAALQGVANDQQITGGAVAGTNAELQNQVSLFQAMTGSAEEQYGIYSEILQAKIEKDREAAQATADSTASTTDSWRDHVTNVGLSLAEYAAALDADVAKHDEHRENIKLVTERGGEEVGAALLAMGEEGAQLTADMANASDEEFRRMADAMTNHARNGGAGAVREMDLAMKAMDYASREGTKATVQGMAEELDIGVAEARRIVAGYGIAVTDSINPVLEALGKQKVGTVGRHATAQTAFRSLDRNADGSVYASGGGPENHVAQIAPAGTWRVWAEPETGGEAYIPLSPAKRRRSLDIWQETGKRLGVEVDQFANGGIPGLVALGRRFQVMGASVSRHGAFGGTPTSGHGRNSKHYTNEAIDINWGAGASVGEQRRLDPLAAMARSLGFRTIWRTKDHWDHLHVDTGSAGVSMGASGGTPAVDVPKPPGMGKFRMPISTLGDAAMEKVYNDAVAWVAENTIVEPGSDFSGASTGTQISNARIIGNVARSMGFGRNGLVVALATALQESGLRNINYGDRDSVGLFQQRPSQGWGTVGQIMNPSYSARKFFEALRGVRGWERLPVTVAAQRVQRSAFPNAYAKHVGHANSLASTVGFDQGGIVDFFAKGGLLNPHVRDTGGPLLPGFTFNGTGAPETVIPNNRLVDSRVLVPFSVQATAGARDGGALIGTVEQHFHGDNSEYRAVEELNHALRVRTLGGKYAGAAA